MEVKEHNHRNEQELNLALPEYNAPTSARSIPNDKLYCISSVGNAILIFRRDRKMCSELKLKICSICKESKPILEFYPHQRTADKLRSECKRCSSIRVRKTQEFYLQANQDQTVDETAVKTCIRCGVTKTCVEFPKDSRVKTGLKAFCKACDHLVYLARKNKSPEQYAYHCWEIKLKREHNLTPAEYEAKVTLQGDSCMICNINKSELSKRLSVDHDHATGENRGLLCDRCNKVLGMVSDSTQLLSECIKYLDKFKK